MKNKFLLASVTFLFVVSLSACTNPKKVSKKSSLDTSSTHVVKETTKSSSKVEKEISDSDKGVRKLNESVQQIMVTSISRVTGKRMIVSKSEIIFSILIKKSSILLF